MSESVITALIGSPFLDVHPPLMHLDLKPENLLLTYSREKKLHVLLSDFGFSQRLEVSKLEYFVTANLLVILFKGRYL